VQENRARVAGGLAALWLLGTVPGRRSTRRRRPARPSGTAEEGRQLPEPARGPQYWKAAAETGLEFVRLLPDAWPTRNRDFLMGSADCFTALDETDLATLRRSLDDAHAAGVGVVSRRSRCRGARWRQLNGGGTTRGSGATARSRPRRRPSATARRPPAGTPGGRGPQPLNEPHPERAFGFEGPEDEGFREWLARARGLPRISTVSTAAS